jgi:hypothetical protein
MTLTRIERNQIYEAIAAGALDPAECSLNQYDDQVEIRHKSSGSTLKLSLPIDTFFGLRQTVAYHVGDGHNNTAYAQPGIDNVTPTIRNWANEVKHIVESPDLWAEMQSSRGMIANIQQSNSDNTPFIPDERRQIVVELEAIKEHVKERFDLTSEQIAHV